MNVFLLVLLVAILQRCSGVDVGYFRLADFEGDFVAPAVYGPTRADVRRDGWNYGNYLLASDSLQGAKFGPCVTLRAEYVVKEDNWGSITNGVLHTTMGQHTAIRYTAASAIPAPFIVTVDYKQGDPGGWSGIELTVRVGTGNLDTRVLNFPPAQWTTIRLLVMQPLLAGQHITVYLDPWQGNTNYDRLLLRMYVDVACGSCFCSLLSSTCKKSRAASCPGTATQFLTDSASLSPPIVSGSVSPSRAVTLSVVSSHSSSVLVTRTLKRSGSFSFQSTGSASTTSTRSLSATRTLPPLVPLRLGSSVRVLSQLLPQDDARAIVSSGHVAAMGISVLGFPASSGYAVRLGWLVQGSWCASQGDDEADLPLTDLLLQANVDGSLYGLYSGSALLTMTILIAVPTATAAALHVVITRCAAAGSSTMTSTLRTVQAKFVAVCCILAYTYYYPFILHYSSVVLFNARSATLGALASAIVALVAPLGVLLLVSWQALMRFDVQVELRERKWEYFNRSSTPAFCETYGELFDGCKNPQKLLYRCCVFEDLFASIALSLLSAWHPTSTAACNAINGITLFVCALHFLYAVVVLPLRSRIETTVSCASATLQCAAALVALLLALDAADDTAMEKLLGLIVLLLNVIFFGGLVWSAAWACCRSARKRHPKSIIDEGESADDARENPLEVPLHGHLQVPSIQA